MRILLSRVGEQGLQEQGEVAAETLELDESSFRPGGPILCDFFVQIVSGRLIVSGSVRMAAELECVRCGVFFSTTVADSSFLRDCLIEPEAFEVDLTKDIREAVLLALPSYPVCTRACKGRCGRCGIDLNVEQCGCEERVSGDPVWSALDTIGLDGSG